METIATYDAAPPRASPGDLTQRPYSDVVREGSLNVLSPYESSPLAGFPNHAIAIGLTKETFVHVSDGRDGYLLYSYDQYKGNAPLEPAREADTTGTLPNTQPAGRLRAAIPLVSGQKS